MKLIVLTQRKKKRRERITLRLHWEERFPGKSQGIRSKGGKFHETKAEKWNTLDQAILIYPETLLFREIPLASLCIHLCTYICIREVRIPSSWTCVRFLRKNGSRGNLRVRVEARGWEGDGEREGAREEAPVMDRPISAARWSTRETERERRGRERERERQRERENERAGEFSPPMARSGRGEERREVMVGSVSC